MQTTLTEIVFPSRDAKQKTDLLEFPKGQKGTHVFFDGWTSWLRFDWLYGSKYLLRRYMNLPPKLYPKCIPSSETTWIHRVILEAIRSWILQRCLSPFLRFLDGCFADVCFPPPSLPPRESGGDTENNRKYRGCAYIFLEGCEETSTI